MVIGTTEHTGYMGYRTPVSPARGSQSQARGSQASETSASDDFSLVSDSRKSNVRRTRAVPSAADSTDSLPEGANTKFTFGQHVGLTYHEVMHKYPGYYLWGKDQKSPSRLLANFLDWATDHYEIDQETNEVLARLEPVGDVPLLPTSVTHPHKSLNGRRKPPHPPLEKCHACVDCGHSTRTRRECMYKNDPATCKHETAEAAADLLPGSFANCVELMWAKCHRKRHAEEHSWVETSALFPQQLLTLLRGRDDTCLTIEGAVQMMHMFQQDVETELQGANGEPIRASVIYEILANSSEAVREAAP